MKWDCCLRVLQFYAIQMPETVMRIPHSCNNFRALYEVENSEKLKTWNFTHSVTSIDRAKAQIYIPVNVTIKLWILRRRLEMEPLKA